MKWYRLGDDADLTRPLPTFKGTHRALRANNASVTELVSTAWGVQGACIGWAGEGWT